MQNCIWLHICIFFFQGRGLTAFIRFKKEYVNSERLRTTAFNTHLHSFSFQVRIHCSYGPLTEINPENRQRNRWGLLLRAAIKQRNLLGFHFFNSKTTLQIGYHPKSLFKKKKKTGKNYQCHILNTLGNTYLVQLQKEYYTFDNLIQAGNFFREWNGSVKTPGCRISKRVLHPQELRGLHTHKNIYDTPFLQECYYIRLILGVAQSNQFWRHKWM